MCRFVQAMVVAVALSSLTALVLGQARPETSAQPALRFDKTRFATIERVFFWIGVTRTDTPIPDELRATGRVIITRPDGTIKINEFGWPIDGNPDRGGWFGGHGLGEEPRAGRYTVVAEFAGRKTQPAVFTVEDVAILEGITGEFAFPSPLTFGPGEDVVLTIRNGSTQTIRFPQRGQMFESVSGRLERTTGTPWSAAFFVPRPLLLEASGTQQSSSAADVFTWDLVATVPTVTLLPGESYFLKLPVILILADLRLTPAEYDLRLSTSVQILVGDRDGPWAGLSPLKVDIASSAHGVLP